MPLYCYSGIMMNLKAEKKSHLKKKSNEPKLNKKPMLNRKELHMNPFFDNVLFRETVNKQLFCSVTVNSSHDDFSAHQILREIKFRFRTENLPKWPILRI